MQTVNRGLAKKKEGVARNCTQKETAGNKNLSK